MQTTSKASRIERSEPEVEVKKGELDFVGLFGFTDGPMAGRRPAKKQEPEPFPLIEEETVDAQPMF